MNPARRIFLQFALRVVVAIAATGALASSWAAEPFNITLTQQNAVSLSAAGAQPIYKQGTSRLQELVSGTENSECRPYGRVSTAAGTADVTVNGKRDDGISIEMMSNSSANGGHYRTCAACINGNCVGVFGNDTKAESTAVSNATVAIHFNNQAFESFYIVDVGVAGHGTAPAIKFSNQSGEVIAPLNNAKGTYRVSGKPGAIYYLTVQLESKSTNQGGCCDEMISKSARIDVNLRRAPLLASVAKLEPYIKGGKATSSYASVGALLIDGELHCTGTLIGTRTILTAAHCLEGYEKQLPTFSFVVGSNVVQPTFGPAKVIGYAYPNGSAGGPRFNRASLEDDIGLIYLDSPPGIEAVELHNGSPKWDDLVKHKISLVFVGYGFDVIKNEPVGSGIKREGAWHMDALENRRVRFTVPGKNTCKGDSGGPAFLIENGKMIQVAITSGGASDCTTGFETRIDAYTSWLSGRIK